MGDTCTGTPTATSFSASTQETFSVSQSTSQSLSIGDASVVTRALASGTDALVSLSTIPGATATVDVVIPITVTGQQVIQVPILTLFAPCATSETTATSTTPTSTSTPTTSASSTASQSTPAAESRTSSTRGSGSNSASASGSSAGRDASTPTPTPTPAASSNASSTETGTIFTTSSFGVTTLPNGSQSSFVAMVTTSVGPGGSLNNNNSGSGGSGSSRAIAIGVGVAGGVVALIILIIGITWHIRRKRRNALELGVDDTDVWGANHEHKTPPGSANPSSRPVLAGRYSYNPYSEARTTSYSAVPTMSPPRSRRMSLGDGLTPRGSVSSSVMVGAGGLTANSSLASRTKTADEILYEAAREGLPRSRGTSATASHRANGSLTASSHMTHNQRNDSVVGLLEAQGGIGHVHDEEFAQHYHELTAAADVERPMSPVSVVAPRLAIANPDADKDL